MRLTETERAAIKKAVAAHFGQDARVLLFGSRTDDTRRGGDIDLLVQTPLTGQDAFRARIDAITAIQLTIGDRKIDLVVDSGTAPDEPPPLVISIARRKGIPL